MNEAEGGKGEESATVPRPCQGPFVPSSSIYRGFWRDRNCFLSLGYTSAQKMIPALMELLL